MILCAPNGSWKGERAAIIDSQSGRPQKKGTTWHRSERTQTIVVDTLGLLLAVVVHPADIQDRDGAKLVLSKLLLFPRAQAGLGR